MSMREGCDSWFIDNGFGMSFAWDINEMVGIKAAW